MNKSSQEILKEATPEELLSCLQLLSLSVVQHRSRAGFVALRTTTDQLRDTENEADVTHLFLKSRQVLQEALDMVRALAAEPAAPLVTHALTVNTPTENRTQLRINIDVPIKVLWPDNTKLIDAKLEDISWGGAALYVDDTEINAGDTLRIILPRPQGGSISIGATILRTEPRPDGNGLEIATRFSSLSTRDAAKLEGILEHLAQSADDKGQRNFARLTQRLDIQFNGEQELRSTLDDISAGGLGITVREPVQIGQSLLIAISTLDESYSLNLRGRVVRQESLRLHSTEVYRVGLKFEHPSEELKKRTNDLISRMTAVTSSS